MFQKHLLSGLVLVIAAVAAMMISGCHRGVVCSCLHGSPKKKADWIVKKVAMELNLNQDQKLELEQCRGLFHVKVFIIKILLEKSRSK